MCNTPLEQKHRDMEPYMQLLEKTIRHTEDLHKMLQKAQNDYPLGKYTVRDIFRTRNCVLCALESLM